MKWVYFFWLGLAGFVTTAQSKELIIGVLEYPPHVTFDKTDSTLIKYVNKTLKDAGYKAIYLHLLPERGLRELQKGQIDLLLPFDKRDSRVATLSQPILHSVPGLCFKKENFIPILSATHRFKGLQVGVQAGQHVVEALAKSEANLVNIKGSDAINRGIYLTQRSRIDAFYHPNPSQVYHKGNLSYKEVACSSFHGYFIGIHIAVSPHFGDEQTSKVDAVFSKKLRSQNYEYFLSQQGQ